MHAATLNPVKHYNLSVGLLQKNDPADFIIIDNLKDFNIKETYINGELVYRTDEDLIKPVTVAPINNFNRDIIKEKDIKVIAKTNKMQVIEAFDGQLKTKRVVLKPKTHKTYAISDTERDILKIAVVNRYNNNAKPAVAFIKNFGIKNGAIASSIAHDSHNIIAIGAEDEHIIKAINMIIKRKGGISISSEQFSEGLELNIAGLISNKNAFDVAEQYSNINNYANKLSSKIKNPYMTMSFMELLVIPELKIGDRGLFDFNNFNNTSLFL